MASQPPTLQQLKSNMKATWMAGDFGKIAAMNEPWGEHFVARLNLQPGMNVLDVACGTGNQSIPAARTGARVTGIDIATNLLSQARARADSAGVFVDFVEGDAEELPFPDARFDVVFSMFGAMFAPRPERVAAELKRVCKPGGLIAMANWTPESIPGQLFGVTARYLPPPPALQPPSRWGIDSVVRERFGNDVEVHTSKQKERADYEELSPAQVVQFFRTYFGPTKASFERLDPSQHAAYTADLERVFTNANEKRNGGTAHEAEYLEVHGRKKN
jgi:ubiquinone/menaquinone biosynthesis C-methylase UbiE